MAARIELRAAVVRVFALTDGRGGWQRAARRHDARGGTPRARLDPWLSMQHGSASVDTWVLTAARSTRRQLLPTPLSAGRLATCTAP